MTSDAVLKTLAVNHTSGSNVVSGATSNNLMLQGAGVRGLRPKHDEEMVLVLLHGDAAQRIGARQHKIVGRLSGARRVGEDGLTVAPLLEGVMEGKAEVGQKAAKRLLRKA